MAIQDKAITIIGSQSTLIGVLLAQNPDGSITMVAQGHTKDGLGNSIRLDDAKMTIQPGQIAVIDNLLARALSEVRKANGLEV